jgi:hypothetical protein
MTSGSPDNQPDSSSRNFPSAASTSPEPGTFHFGGQRPGLVRRNVGLGRVAQPAQEDVVEVLFHLGLVQLLQDSLFQVFRPFPEGGMGLLAAVGVDLLVARDLLNQVGQEEREARKWLTPSTLPGLCERRRRGAKSAEPLLERNRFAVGQKRKTGVSHGFIFRPWPFL